MNGVETIPPDPRFAERLLAWFDVSGRHDLPWQHPRTPYRVWLSEIMLQQTQVRVVIPYFERFVRALPDMHALAEAPLDDVLALWSGLGYYARARNLHAAAKHCVERHAGELPRDPAMLRDLPGIGRSTAGAILAQAWNARFAILDGNVKRVLCRIYGLDGWPGTPAAEKRLWSIAESLLPAARIADYTQAQMDFGATLCTRHDPACVLCPLQSDCKALREGRVAELPTPKPGKPMPERACVVMLLRDAEGRVLLQRRPKRKITTMRAPGSMRICAMGITTTPPLSISSIMVSPTTGCGSSPCAGAQSPCATRCATIQTCAGSRATILTRSAFPPQSAHS